MSCECEEFPLIDIPRMLHDGVIGWRAHDGWPWGECFRRLAFFSPSSGCPLLPSG